MISRFTVISPKLKLQSSLSKAVPTPFSSARLYDKLIRPGRFPHLMSRCENDSRCRGTMVVLLTWGSLYLALSLAIAGPQGKQEKSTEVTNPFDRDKYAIEMGRQHFQAGCAFCHGTRGEGGRGPYLSESSRVRNLEDKKLFRLLRNGIPGTPMPPSSLDATKLWQLVSFLRSLHFSASQEEIPGDPEIRRSTLQPNWLFRLSHDQGPRRTGRA